MKKSKPFPDPEGHKTKSLWLTSELAAALRLTDETIRRGIRTARIEARKVGRGWRIPNEEAERIIRDGLE